MCIAPLLYGHKKVSLIQINLCFAIQSKKSFVNSKKFVHCYTVKEKFLWFKKNFFESNKFVHCYTAKEKFLWFKQKFWIAIRSKKNFKMIKLNKIVLKFLSVLYPNQKNIVSNQINNIKKISVFLFRIEEMKLKKRFLKFE